MIHFWVEHAKHTFMSWDVAVNEFMPIASAMGVQLNLYFGSQQLFNSDHGKRVIHRFGFSAPNEKVLTMFRMAWEGTVQVFDPDAEEQRIVATNVPKVDWAMCKEQKKAHDNLMLSSAGWARTATMSGF